MVVLPQDESDETKTFGPKPLSEEMTMIRDEDISNISSVSGVDTITTTTTTTASSSNVQLSMNADISMSDFDISLSGVSVSNSKCLNLKDLSVLWSLAFCEKSKTFVSSLFLICLELFKAIYY